jgi:hypothetical protein
MSKMRVNECGCWMWEGSVSPQGYGQINVNGRTWGAHRMSYIAFHEDDPGDLLICHSCDVPLCVNPDHLWAGTATANMQDCISKGRSRVYDRTEPWKVEDWF